jgi:hypothetical protein
MKRQAGTHKTTTYHPDDFGQHWGVRFQTFPVLTTLFRGTLF